MSEKKQGQFLPTLSLSSAILLVLSSILGTGVYKKVAPMSADLHSPSLVMLCWFLGGVISLCGALSNAEIAGMFAGTGGEYVYYKKIYNKFLAFMMGWSVFTVIKTASISSIAYVFSESVNGLIHLPRFSPEIEEITFLGTFTPLENFGVKALTALLIFVLTLLNTRGLKGVERLSRYLTQLIVGGLAFVVISSFIFGGGSVANLAHSASNEPVLTGSALFKGMFAALLATFWGYEGWNTLGYMAGEIKEPRKNVPLALTFGLLGVMAIYILVNTAYLYVLPVEQIIAGFKAQNDIAAVAVVRSFSGGIGATVLSVLIILTTLSCTNATILMPPRMYQIMSEDGLFFERAKEIHPEYNTPNFALWIQGIWAIVLVFSGSFDQLTDRLIFAAFFFYGATAFGVFVLRVRYPNLERPYKVIGYPFVPAIFVLFCAVLIVTTCYSKPNDALIGLLLILSGVPFYFWWSRKNKLKEATN